MRNRDEEAERLATAHYRVEEGITQIFRLLAPDEEEQQPDEPIKLLEVNRFTIPSGIMPLQFGPSPDNGIHFPSVIVEITPGEFAELQHQRLKLPDGWIIGGLFPPPARLTA